MPQSVDFMAFKQDFFNIFTFRTFNGSDYLSYLNRPVRERSNDEASAVDVGIVSRVLELLGFIGNDQNYNRAKENIRPDFAPFTPGYGICFIVEDKNTTLDLTLDLHDSVSHLSQLAGYLRNQGLRLGWLTNGRRLTAWRFDDFSQPNCLIDIDLPQTVQEWQSNSLTEQTEQSLRTLFDLFRREVFSSQEFLAAEIAVDLDDWQAHALPLGGSTENISNEYVLVDSLKTLVEDLHSIANRQLLGFFQAYQEYSDKLQYLPTDPTRPAMELLHELRSRLLDAFNLMKNTLGLEQTELVTLEQILEKLQNGIRVYSTLKKVETDLLTVINTARGRKFGATTRAGAPLKTLDELNGGLANQLKVFVEKALSYQQHLALLRQTYGRALDVYDNYLLWEALVQETMLGELNEEQRKREFALQAAYVVFIRLLLIRVCEDKGIFAQRFVSDGGIKHWQDDIKRYLKFAQGNPYSFLLDMAYKNAQNIYAHFFTGRDLFNWFEFDENNFILALRHLNRFNFANVDSDIIGTIYNTYVNREEKQKKGQYYTPVPVVDYILDEVGYKQGGAIIGGNKKLLDPACGSGTFLVRAARRLVETYRNSAAQGQSYNPVQILEQIRDNLYGFEINPFACYLSEVNLLIQTLDLVKDALDRNQMPDLRRFHVYNVDTLARPTGAYYSAQLNTLLAEETDEVDRIKRRAEGTAYANGFAFVVANPPYGAKLGNLYKNRLKEEWSDISFGQPDTFVFFLKFGTDLLARNGRLGFITPNTYLMGTNTEKLRAELLKAGRIEQIVDLPKGIWHDANVDCVLLFLAAETDETKRRAQQVKINILGLRESLDKLAERTWFEELIQSQASWIDHPQSEFDIKYDVLSQKIETACLVPTNALLSNGSAETKVLRLGDITESTQGIIPYHTKSDSVGNPFIKSEESVPRNTPEWKPTIDRKSFVGRYEMRWGVHKPYIKYGNWLYTSNDSKYYENPKILFVRLRNRALNRRLVGTYDSKKFYNRHKVSNIIAKSNKFDLKYILAVFNSSLLNFWYKRKYHSVEISVDNVRNLPIYPASAEQQQSLVSKVDELLAAFEKLNQWREQGYSIQRKSDGNAAIAIPYTLLLAEIQRADRNFPVLTLFQATAAGLITIPQKANLAATVGSNVYVPDKYPTSLVLRHNKLWLDIPGDKLRRFLANYLSQPQWRGQTWQNNLSSALIPEDETALDQFYQLEATRQSEINLILEKIKQLDNAIDLEILDLYGINDPVERQRILQAAPTVTDDESGEISTTDEESELD